MNHSKKSIRRISNFILKTLGFSVPVFHGRGFSQNFFGFMPRRYPVTVVIGKSIECPKIECPTDEDVSKVRH